MFNILKTNISKAVKHNKRKIEYPDLVFISSVGFVTLGEPEDILTQCIVPGANATVRCLSYMDSKRETDTRDEIIYRSDLSFFKLPPKKLTNSFINEPFDILINFAGCKNDVLNYICAQSKAKFKVSAEAFSTVFDLVIDVPVDDKDRLMGELVKTLSKLKPLG